jgi:L-fucose mutarotase
MLMLKGIDPVLTPDLLKLLCEMGHGDEIVLADSNFTANSLAQGRPVIRLPGVDLRRACLAVLSVFPLDSYVERPVGFMKVSDSAEGFLTPMQRSVLEAIVGTGAVTAAQIEPIERFAFYDRTRRAQVIVQTGELQPWGNVVLKKGVIVPSAAAT